MPSATVTVTPSIFVTSEGEPAASSHVRVGAQEKTCATVEATEGSVVGPEQRSPFGHSVRPGGTKKSRNIMMAWRQKWCADRFGLSPETVRAWP
jgi:hypothetical protein